MLHRLEKKFAPARYFYLPAYPKMIMQNGLVFVFPLLLFPSLYSVWFFPSYLLTLPFLFLSFISSVIFYLLLIFTYFFIWIWVYHVPPGFPSLIFFCCYLIMPSLLHLFLAFAFFSFKQKVMFAAYETCSLFFSLCLFFSPSLQQTTSLI